jgi:bifunctional non-homologous end joining protein LigD
MPTKKQPSNKSSKATSGTGKKPADLIDMQLEKYRSMRNFAVTREPAGTSRTKPKEKDEAAGLPFVIQKHAATRLHYDFRLGWNGVLKSWAVTKGPSYCTKDKRLAVQVEDHPMEYGGFEGVIPKGEYGGGTVMLWDSGTWEPQAAHPDVDAGLKEGSLKFTLHGTKMKGNWALIRMGGKATSESKPNWLLIKEHDDFERHPGDPEVVEEMPKSVVTHRSMDEIAEQSDHVWDSQGSRRSARQGKVAAGDSGRRKPYLVPRSAALSSKIVEMKAKSKPVSTKAKVEPITKAGASRPSAAASDDRDRSKKLLQFPKEQLPSFIAPQLAMKASKPPELGGWVHELKLDGYRVEAHKSGGNVKLFTRSGLDWTHRMKPIAAEVARLPAKSAIIDGEVVVLSSNGTTSFADLQASFQDGANHPLTYFVFDLLHLDGHNLRDAELLTRKRFLSELLEASSEGIRLSEHFESDGAAMLDAACKLHAEGIVSKRASSKYASGRNAEWLKVKCAYDQEFVIGGFTLPSNGTHGVGALLLGYYDDDGMLIYAGRTGTGFTQRTHASLRKRLDAIKATKCSFDTIATAAKRNVIWVKPDLVAQVSFATWTADNLVRQAAFKGLREDKKPSEVRRERDLNDSAEPAGKESRSAARYPAAVNIAAKVVSASSASVQGPLPRLTGRESHAPVRLTHPDKVLDLDSGVTKQQLADYYWAVADHLLPQIANRPLSLVRCPEGSTKPCFFQKHTNDTLPRGIESIEITDKKSGKPEPYITLSTAEALAGLAQLGVLELHPWGSTNDDLERPDRIVIDLDPDQSVPWETLTESAAEVRKLLKDVGLESFLKGTGGKGLHIVVPILPEHDWSIVKQFAHTVALTLEQRNPSLYLTKMSKAARKGKIFIDYLRNERGATAVSAYSPRARAGMTVSVPLAWRELDSSSRPVFAVADFASWKKRLSHDPWKTLANTQQRLFPEAAGKLS